MKSPAQYYIPLVIFVLAVFSLSTFLVREKTIAKIHVFLVLQSFDQSQKTKSDFLMVTENIAKIVPATQDENPVDVIQKYHTMVTSNGYIIPWPHIFLYEQKTIQREIPVGKEVVVISELPSTFQVSQRAGVPGKQEEHSFHFLYLNKGASVEGITGDIAEAMQPEVILQGTGEETIFTTTTATTIQKIAEYLKNNDQTNYENVIEDSSKDSFEKAIRLVDRDHKFSSVQIKEVKVSETIQFEKEKSLKVATIVLSTPGCSQTPSMSLYFSPSKKTFTLDNFVKAFDSLCVKAGDFAILSCVDCKFAPIGSKKKLASSYVPQVVDTGLAGGGYLTPEAKENMQRLFNDAKNSKGQKINIKIKWGYRSYKLQETLFNEYVEGVLKQYGVSREEAIRRTKERVAPPGESEHQLGTVADIECYGCDDSNKIYRNSEIYMFLNRSAHNYGFVVSFTQSCQQFTGIIYEPWHIRYVGKEFATEMFNRGYLNCTNGLHVGSFMEEKGLY